MAQFEVDITADSKVEDTLVAFIKHGLVIEGFTPAGPAGGHPCFRLGGHDNDFRSWLRENFGESDIEVYRV